MNKKFKEETIEFLKPRDAVRKRPGMYIGSVSNADVIFREIIDNACDEISAGYGDSILVSNNFEGYCFIADNGRGIPVSYSKDKPGVTQAYLSISELHSGSKFNNTDSARVGQNGVGSSASNFLSSEYWLLSRIGEHNYSDTIPDVRKVWESAGPRSKRDIYYFVKCESGEKTLESCGHLKDISKLMFGKKSNIEIPGEMSTMVFFKPDPSIFESCQADVPLKNLQYFLLIQEKFYKRKVNVYVDGKKINNSFKPYRYELVETITPKDNTYNKQVGIYITFEVDKSLGPKSEIGSVNGLEVNQGQHITIAESCYKTALKDVFKIKHEYLTNGLQMCVILLAGELMFDSQTKARLKSITKVKVTDFTQVVKSIEKIFKKDPDYWNLHVAKLDKLASSMKDIGASELAEKFMSGTSGVGLYRNKSNLVPGFTEATGKNRMDCELFLCFTGDTEILTCNNERITFKDLVRRIGSGEQIYTFSCDSKGVIEPSKIIAAKKIKSVNSLVKVTLDNGESFRCTPDHKIMLKSGVYTEASNLKPNQSLMPLYIKEETSKVGKSYEGDPNTTFKRRIVKSSIPTDDGKYGKRVSSGYYVYRVMSTHKDVVVDESFNKIENEKLKQVRHHIDHNTLNDSPNNLMLCSNAWHRAHHGAIGLYKKAKQNEELYNNVYVKSKRTEKFRSKLSQSINELYKTERGNSLRDYLKKKAIKEWESKELRDWRSKETRKYCKEHPDFGKNNKILAEKAFESREVLENTEVLKGKGIPLTAKGFNMISLDRYYTSNRKIKVRYFETILEHNPELLKDYDKSFDETCNAKYILVEKILEELKSAGLEVNLKNFNKFAKKYSSGKSKLENGVGYLSSKRKFPKLFEKYEFNSNINHKVISVEIINTTEDVYCLEVDNPLHNFPLASGVFVKNCEGLSAAGSLVTARPDTTKFAILPLRGKILNVTGVSAKKALESQTIYSIFSVIGLGLDVNNVVKDCKTREEAIEILKQKSRYGKIIVSTDADADGSAIAVELFHMFGKYASFMIDLGLIYRVISPLWKGKSKTTGRMTYYYPDDPSDQVTGFPLDMDEKCHYSRFKGLTN